MLRRYGSAGSSARVSCDCCTAGVAPLQVQVEALGVVTGPEEPCGQCDELNGTYILTWLSPAEYGDFCLPPNPRCAWGLVFDTVCGRNKAQLFMLCEEFPDPFVYVSFSIDPVDCFDPINGSLSWWKQTDGVSTIDCLWNGYELTAPSGGPAASCELLGAPTATLYAL
jgi:hypothetical protein